jgi:CubicO group peptidase (beta-lactamase class C family)
MSNPTRVLVLVLALAANLSAQSSDSAPPHFDKEKLAQIPTRMQGYVADKTIAGAVTVVATKDQIVRLDAIGLADVANDVAMKPDAVFWIASMTKPVTATAILMLQDEGKLSVDDPVAKYLPELAALKGPDGKPANVTLKHLLTHTSGMVSEATSEERKDVTTLAQLVPLYAKYPLQFEPGTKWAYCQSGINSLGRVVEVVSGMSLPDFFQKRIFDPLGMKDTTFYPSEEQAARLAKSYKSLKGQLEETRSGMAREQPVTSHDHYPAANAGLFTTAADYTRFCQMLLSDGSFEGRVYLKPETVKAMRTIQTGDIKTGFTPGNGWGLGVCVIREPKGVTATLSPGTFGHGGAFGTQAWIDPERGIIYVLMIQWANAPNSDASSVRQGFQEAVAASLPK